MKRPEIIKMDREDEDRYKEIVEKRAKYSERLERKEIEEEK